MPFAVGTVTLSTGLLVRRWRPRWPHYILAVAAGMISAQVLDLAFGSATTQLDMAGRMTLDSLPLSFPDFPPDGFTEFSTAAYPAALSMAVLGLMQSAVIARSLAVKSRQSDVKFNQEALGQGLSNLLGSFFSCFTSCGSFNRSAANLAADARTPRRG